MRKNSLLVTLVLVIPIFCTACIISGRDWPQQECKSLYVIQKKISLPFKYPWKYTLLHDKTIAARYFIEKVPRTGDGNRPKNFKLVDIGYSIQISNIKSANPACSYKSISLRAINLGQAAKGGSYAVAREEYDYDTYDLIAPFMETRFNGKIIVYYAYRSHRMSLPEIYREKGLNSSTNSTSSVSSAYPKSDVFEFFCSYWMDGNTKYSIIFNDFQIPTSPETIDSCIDESRKYFDTL